ncbi:MAG: enoyl-CoA hydratase/isomerase family protein, partial [Acidiferrobacterales bacterium]
MGHVLTDRRGDVLHVLINRPQKRNALSRAVLAELSETFNAAAADADLRAAVLRGAGDKNFAAGGDLIDLSEVRTLAEATVMANEARAALDTIRRFPVPVVAALNGDALGGGAELAVACDFRILAAHARIGFIQGRLNISTAWGGGVDLADLVGPAAALRLLSRSDLVTGKEALSIGLADAVASAEEDVDDAVRAFLEPVVRQAPQVLRAFKSLAIEARLGHQHEQLRALETRLFSHTWI